MSSATLSASVAVRPRDSVRVAGPQAGEYLQRMVSNDVLALEAGASCEALLLTPKARVIAPLRVVRRADHDFLLLTEPGLGDVVRDHLLRMRFAARAEIEREDHACWVVLAAAPPAAQDWRVQPTDEYGVPGWELLDAPVPAGARELSGEELERLRIEAGTPRFGREIDDRVLPAEAGLDERAISFTKGCYPGQEPVARLRYRGHANRALRVLRIETGEPPPYDAEILLGERVVGRVTSAVRAGDAVSALGYVRVEVTPGEPLTGLGRPAAIVPPRRPGPAGAASVQ